MDIGGTFTDFVLFDSTTGTYLTEKVSTTPKNLAEGILRGLENLGRSLGDIEFCVHGTTAGLNAFLERKGARVALITTQGFRDVYEIARGNRPEMYNIRYRKPKPLIRRRDVFEVEERTRYDGSIMKPLDTGSLEEVANRIREDGYESITVALLHSYMNPSHEMAVREYLRQHLPGVSVTLSHEVSREWREYERTSTSVLNAYVAPIVERYLSKLEEEVQDRGLTESLYIMRSNGGVMTAEVAKANPIQTLLSGPVGGAVGGVTLAETGGYENLVLIDMGGTSFDVSMVIKGRPDVTTETDLEGFPVLTPMVNIHTIGAGGGSIAWLEEGGLRVGPASAGADPGPACYGRGGTESTVTDANVTLGRIDPDHFLGGNMRLHPERSIDSVRRIADRLGLPVVETAEGICDVANAKMADAIRQITVRKGIDPRDFSLVAFGGAGPMHAVFIAEELGIRTVMVPSMPGAFSAWGMLTTDIRHDEVGTFFRPATGADVQEIDEIFQAIEQKAAGVLARQKVSRDKMTFGRSADMRYMGQEYTVNVLLPQTHGSDVTSLVQGFHDKHLDIYGHNSPNEPVEFVNLRVAGMGQLDICPAQALEDAVDSSPRPRTRKMVTFRGELHETAVYNRSSLRHGHSLTGPAIIEELTATTVVPPGYGARVDRMGTINITPVEARQ
jgi:N-methylhydantoinase A